MKIYWNTPYDRNRPSSRIRVYHTHDELLRRGMKSTILYRDTPPPSNGKGNVLIIQKRYREPGRDYALRAKKLGYKVIFDSDDPHPAHHFITKGIINREFIDAVTVDTHGHSQFYGGGCEVIPDAVDYDFDGPRRREHKDKDRIDYVWHGLACNGGVLEWLIEPLSHFESGTWTFSVITNARQRKHIGIKELRKYVVWDYKSFIRDISQFDVCVIPQRWWRKSSNKMIAAIMAGLPVVASNIPSYMELADATGVSEFFVEGTGADAWERPLRQIQDAEVRNEYLNRTQDYIWEQRNVRAITDKWVALFERLLER